MRILSEHRSGFKKMFVKLYSLARFLSGIFCFLLGAFIVVAFVPKIWEVMVEYYKLHEGNFIGMLNLEGVELFSLVPIPVIGISYILYVLGSSFLRRNYYYLVCVRRVRLGRGWLLDEISCRASDFKGMLFRPMLVRELIYALAVLSLIFGIYQNFSSLFSWLGLE